MPREGLKALEERTRYDPAEVEPRVLAKWLEAGYFHAEPGDTPDENYSIAIPPPNVTGVLHMGHALNASVQDTLIRFNRMSGRRTKWIFGTDHAGIATQAQVEKLLVVRGHQQGGDRAARSSTAACGSGASSTAARSSSSSSAWARRATTSTSASRSTSATSRRS